MEPLVLLAVAVVSGFIGFIMGKSTGARGQQAPSKESLPGSPDSARRSAEHKGQDSGKSFSGALEQVDEQTRQQKPILHNLANADNVSSLAEQAYGQDSAYSSITRIPEGAEGNGALERVKDLLKSGKKIEALKVYRGMSGLGLKEAKDELDRIERAIRLGID